MYRTALICISLQMLAPSSVWSQSSSDASSEGSRIAWESDYDAGLAKAKASGLPIMVFFTMNGEPANELIHRDHLRRPEIIEASRQFVCLVACRGSHSPKEATSGDAASSCCSRFGKVTCDEHEKVEMRARLELMDAPQVKCPQFVFLRSDATENFRHIWALSPAELLEKMTRASGKSSSASPSSGPDLSELKKQASSRRAEERMAGLHGLAKVDGEESTAYFAEVSGPRSKLQQRLEAIMALGESRKPGHLGTLHLLLKDHDSKVRTHASVALEKIASADSVGPLRFAINSERDESTRSNLLRALAACGGDGPEVRDGVKRLLGMTGRTDRLAGLFVAAKIAPDDDIKSAVAKLARTSNTQVRAAAYLVIGTHGLTELKDLLKKRSSGEKALSKAACLWALDRLGEGSYDGSVDPESELEDLLPDNCLREGKLSSSHTSTKRNFR